MTAKQEKYALLLFEGKSQRQAYFEAYPSSKKWKDEAVDAQASRLSKNNKVVIRLKELRDKVAQKSIMTKEQVLQEWSKIANIDTSKLYDKETGQMLQPNEWDKDTARAVAGFKTRREGGEDTLAFVDDVKMHDKTKALDALSKHYGLYEKDNVLNLNIDEQVKEWLQK